MHPYTIPVDGPSGPANDYGRDARSLAEMLHPSEFTHNGQELRAHVLRVMDAAEATALYLAGKIGWTEYRGTLLDLIDEEADSGR